MEHNFFPQRPTITPTIYAYRLPGVDSHKGYLKVGYTDRSMIAKIETGKVDISVETLNKFAVALDSTIVKLLDLWEGSDKYAT